MDYENGKNSKVCSSSRFEDVGPLFIQVLLSSQIHHGIEKSPPYGSAESLNKATKRTHDLWKQQYQLYGSFGMLPVIELLADSASPCT